MKFIKSALVFGIPFGLCMGLFWSAQYGLWHGVASGVAAGILFGACMAFSIVIAQKRIKKAEVLNTETISETEILFNSYASITSFPHKPGQLLLTKTHLVFIRIKNKNSQPQRLEIALGSIQAVKTFKNLMCDNGLIVIHSGHEQKFYLMGRIMPNCIMSTTWVEKIQNAIKEIQSKENI